MSQFTHEVRNGDRLGHLRLRRHEHALGERHPRPRRADCRAATPSTQKTPLKGVILKGNRHGLGAGANIGELMNATRAQLEELIDAGNAQLFAIEEGPLPWVALLDGIALGGIYELALACHAIVATERSTVGFPEIRLNIFPGLGGTQRMPRRSGLVNASDPISGDAASPPSFTARTFRGQGGRDQDDRRGHSRRRPMPTRSRSASCSRRCRRSTARRRADLANAEALAADDPADDREGDDGPAESARALRGARRDGQGRHPAACATPSSSSATRSSRSPRRPRARPACASSSRSRRCRSSPKDFPGKARPLDEDRHRRHRRLHGQRHRLAGARSRLSGRRPRAAGAVRRIGARQAEGEVRARRVRRAA